MPRYAVRRRAAAVNAVISHDQNVSQLITIAAQTHQQTLPLQVSRADRRLRVCQFNG
jgi:hypothetical protein